MTANILDMEISGEFVYALGEKGQMQVFTKQATQRDSFPVGKDARKIVGSVYDGDYWVAVGSTLTMWSGREKSDQKIETQKIWQKKKQFNELLVNETKQSRETQNTGTRNADNHTPALYHS
eukprot:TRINITY_DN12411_c0_g1_i1.p1 TRINITY_DN12411_c0_g1~~TRINITY_DN12411_c0_g1_i1.p1  ORF type:complete len:128 (-),score=34.98 TRINITY_DN12411_c0_g1_i1:106-468(-)